MKLSFSLSSKPSSKPKPQQTLRPSHTFTAKDQAEPSSNKEKEYVTEFDATNTLDSQPKKFIIPPQPNEWQPHKKMKNLLLPPIQSSDGSNLQFEKDLSGDPAEGSISYGLNLRQSSQSDADPAVGVKPDSIDTLLLNKLKADMKKLPDEGGLEDFNEVPVESFAAAVLAGYGWHEGRGIGRNAKEDVKVVEYKHRNGREGFGMPKDSNYEIDRSGSGLNGNRGVHEQKEEKREEQKRERYYVGKGVRIIGGREMGIEGRISEVVAGGDAVILKFSKSKKVAKVRTSDIADLGSVEEEKCLRKLREYNDGKRESKGDREKVKSEKKEKSRAHEPVSWLASYIRVKIINKDLRGGCLYLKKGKVVDVVGPTTCDISMDDSGELIQGVEQEYLETAIPRRGGPVLVLYGRHKGTYGSLVERDPNNETAVVRDADTHEMLNVQLEQIAEYTGDPSYIGY